MSVDANSMGSLARIRAQSNATLPVIDRLIDK